MLEKISHKRRFFIVILLLVLLFLAVYKKTYQPIFQLNKELNASYQLVENVTQPFAKIESLKNELSVLDKVVGNSENHALIQQKILDFITTHALHVSVVNIADSHMYKGNNAFSILTNKIILTGNYETLLNTIYTIEKEFKASKIVSAKFYSKKNYSTNKTELLLELYFQNYGK